MLFSKVMAGENRSAGYWERAARVLERCIIVCKAAEKCVKLKKYFPANGLGIAKTLFILRDDINKFNKVYYVFDSKEMQWQYARETLYNLSLIHICRCRRYAVCRSRWSPYH
eukprot:TRINITY_DN2237_c0_g2_i8.p3 TRINITY_DN2237_c0_g2~~TRINITY_DN2237_c0_g2_i8.p3  ORF type:complete len:112 (-),score=23.31 TRINITY_DN2237_c0_g2_i8:24-359(-)